MSESTITSFVAEQRQLLALELEADSEEPKQNLDDEVRPRGLGNLENSGVSVGLYGRTVVELTACIPDSDVKEGSKPKNLPPHPFSVGDEVELRSKSRHSNFPRGVISFVSDTSISVALSDKRIQNKTEPNENNTDADFSDGIVPPNPLSLVHRNSAEVNRKLLYGLSQLEKKGVDHPIAGQVVNSIFSLSHDSATPLSSDQDLTFYHQRLDSSQKEAIRFALNDQRKISLIHGPPGTGKTTTLVELVRQAVHISGMKVLVTAPSNVAVDNVLERLAEPLPTLSLGKVPRKERRKTVKGMRMVRLGHPARIKDATKPYSLEALIQSADGTEIVADIRKELHSYLKLTSDRKSRPSDKRAAYREMKILRKEVRSREEKVVRDLVGAAQVVLATTVGAASRVLDHVVDGFDLVVIDEAAQALEASCWLPILRGRKAVLCGDHLQLPPTIKSNLKKVQVGLGKTLFEKLMHGHGGHKAIDEDGNSSISRMLNVQYRMNKMIADWASNAMYQGALNTHESVGTRTLSELDGVKADGEDLAELIASPLVLIDTAGCEMHETVNAAGSKSNVGEATIVQTYAQKLLDAGVRQEHLCIITPYNGQVELLKNLLAPSYPNLEIRTVDGFQGGEKDVVILSLVRSSDGQKRGGIGFLADNRRQNVAITRAKRHLAVVCDTDTVSKSDFINSLIKWIANKGIQRSAMEFSSVQEQLHASSVKQTDFNLVATQKERESGTSKRKENMKKVEIVEDAVPETKDDNTNRKKLFDKMDEFASSGTPGETLDCGENLSSFDHRAVVELAGQLGLERVNNESGGLVFTLPEGRERRQEAVHTEEAELDSGDPFEIKSTLGKFEELRFEDDEDSDSASGNDKCEAETKMDGRGDAAVPSGNSVLAQLAREREQRRKDNLTTQPQTKQAKPKPKKKGNGKRLGGKAKLQEDNKVADESLDDMAFLDAQINIVQNSHGRKVSGSGKGYRTVINGILNAPPPPPPDSRDARKSSALRSKLKEAESARKPKNTKKKKKK